MYGVGAYGSSPYGGAAPPFGVLGATALMPVIVQVVFNDLLDLTNPLLTNTSSYTLTPSVPIHSVNIETAGSVRLTTDYLSNTLYTVHVVGPTTYTGRIMDDALRNATFDGFPISESFRPVPVSYRKVRLLFSSTMTVNHALTDPRSYRITTHTGVDLPILQVIPEGPVGAPLAVSLVLGADLIQRGVHEAYLLSPDIRDQSGNAIKPRNLDFHWIPPLLHATVPFHKFSGEERGGLLGQHNGLAFFSPALTSPAPNSAIQVEEVSVCTRAHDVYQIPNPPDPKVLFLFRPGVATGRLSTASDVAFASFDKLGGVKANLRDLRRDSLAPPVDSRCIATLVETLEPTRAPRLNALKYSATPPHYLPAWPIFDGISTTPFATASNLTPIPPGVTTVRTLET